MHDDHGGTQVPPHHADRITAKARILRFHLAQAGRSYERKLRESGKVSHAEMNLSDEHLRAPGWV